MSQPEPERSPAHAAGSATHRRDGELGHAPTPNGPQAAQAAPDDFQAARKEAEQLARACLAARPELREEIRAQLRRRLEAMMQCIEREAALNRAHLARLEGVLARQPFIRKIVQSYPRNLKAQWPELVPFPMHLWRKPGEVPERGAGPLRGAQAKWRISAAFEYLDLHPRATLAQAARYAGVAESRLRVSRQYRGYLAARGETPAERVRGRKIRQALEYLATHRPRSIYEVACAVKLVPQNLTVSREFLEAWARYEQSPDCRQNSRSKAHSARATQARLATLRRKEQAQMRVRRGPPHIQPYPWEAQGAPGFDKRVYQTARWLRVRDYVRYERARGYCEDCGMPHGTISPDGRTVRLLSCAHLDGNSRNLRLENLRALCQECHTKYDRFRRAGQRMGLSGAEIAALAAEARRRGATGPAEVPKGNEWLERKGKRRTDRG